MLAPKILVIDDEEHMRRLSQNINPPTVASKST